MILQKMKCHKWKGQVKKGTVIVVPIGSTEQHGPHLPIDTNIAIPYYLAVETSRRAHAVVASPANYGYNEKELDFPATVSVKSDTFVKYLFHICDSLCRTGF